MDVLEAKQLVIKAGKALRETGLIARTWGNVSCRTDENHFVISASGRDYETLTEDEVIEMNLESLSYEGKIKPSSEKRVHQEIYKLKEDVGFIIHTHQHNASAVSAMNLRRIKLDREYPGLGEFVLCSEYGLPSTSKVSDKVAEAVHDSIGNAVIMSNHGAVCYGWTYEEAFEIVQNLETACGRFLDFMGIDPWDGEEDHFAKEWNDTSVVLKYLQHRQNLPAYLDDFAQMIGPQIPVYDEETDDIEALIAKAIESKTPLLVRGRGAMCNAETEDDRIAQSMIIEKNCRAALAGFGSRPIGRYESIFMRQYYLQKYSRLKNAGKDGEDEGDDFEE
ncbi:MAG: class II aldolase/adducin family protein [Firmicutes bacterium]|nr:class II aldolase/adducin family protein [Bacillota bacterium]